LRDKSSQAVTISLNECAEKTFFSFIESCGRFMLTIPLFSINMLLFNLLFQGRRNRGEGDKCTPFKILADPLALPQSGTGADYTSHIATRPPGFSDLPKALPFSFSTQYYMVSH
jgi:hypothetical protein